MSAKENTRTDRLAVASRYAEWVRREMQARHMDQALLARRSGLPKQTVNVIVNAQAQQPTAKQVVALARAFRIDPIEVLQALGLWADPPGSRIPMSDQVAQVYRSLGFPARRAWLRLGHILREMEEEYAAMQDRGDAYHGPPNPTELEKRLGMRPAAFEGEVPEELE